MDEHMDSILRGGPVTGSAIAIASIVGYAYHTTMKFMVDAHSVAAAAVPSGWTWDNAGQAVTALLAILGGVFAFASGWYNRRQDDRRDNAKKDADLARDQKVEDSLAAIKVMVAEHLAIMQLKQADVSAHLSRQDATLEQIKQASGPPVIQVSAASGTTNNVVPTILALAPPPETKPSS